MECDRSTRLFFDATCLVAAAGSPAGGSSFLLSLCQRGLLVAIVSRPVLIEARRNIAAKLPSLALDRYMELRRTVLRTLVPISVSLAKESYGNFVTEKDAHVLAAALEAGARVLITLDRPLAQRVNEGHFGIAAMSPGDFIKSALPNHPDYSMTRS
jgi:predicted nucleic acid-binding protein